ncbi:MAG: M28 family peptidase [Bacteroides sp.]|nr:M28 family peptidase [Bacteroides sp.]
MKQLFLTIIMSAAAMLSAACSGKSATDSSTADENAAVQTASLPMANADSLYRYVSYQTAMGPRVPGSEAHARCVEYIKQRLVAAGADVTVQDTLYAAPGAGMKPQRVQNITGTFNAGAPHHVLLLAHFDTRPNADQEEDITLHSKAIDGANDGASGVAVLLEIARLMKQMPADVEVEMLFTDAEDGGSYSDDYSWCIGAQAWADAFDPTTRRVPEYAILLDMVGGQNAVFSREFFSERYARHINSRVWDAARKLGYGDRFTDDIGCALNDDHIHIMRVGIPAIDIVESSHPQTGSFNPTWHTLDDNLEHIDRNTMKMVADVVISVLKGG